MAGYYIVNGSKKSSKKKSKDTLRQMKITTQHGYSAITHYLWSPQPPTACPIHDMADKAQWLNAKERNQMLPNLTAVK